MLYQEPGPYLKVIRKNYSKTRWSDIKIYDQGKRHIVMVVNKRDVFRFPKNEDVARRMEAGVLFANVVRGMLPVRIPEQKFVCDVEKKITYSTYHFLPGVICTKNLFSGFSRVKQRELAQCVGGCLTLIHSYPISDAKRLGVMIYYENKVYHRDFRAIKKKVVPLLSLGAKRWVKSLYLNFFNSLKKCKFRHTVTHFDPKPDHIIVNPQNMRTSGFVDCDEVEVGDPAFDFRKLDEYGEWFLKEVYDYYGIPKDKEFENRRRFYKFRSPVGTLLAAVKLDNKADVQKAKNHLERYCKTHPL